MLDRKQMTLFMAAISLLGLTGCEMTKEQLGLTRRSPDEFMVMSRAPLEMPQNMTSLPAPHPGMKRPQETPAVAQAKQAIIGSEQVTHLESQSSSEQMLLQKTGATTARSDIRAIVNKEAIEDVEDKRPVIKKLLNVGSDQPPATIVDPAAEAERIKANKAAGKPLTEGETPTIDD